VIFFLEECDVFFIVLTALSSLFARHALARHVQREDCITKAIFEEPVVASDGRTYSKKALRSFMSSCKERGLPVTSPFAKALSK
jgi:hypothetical protein